VRVKALIKYSGGVLLAVFLMGWVLRGTDLRLLGEQLRQVSWPGLLTCAVLNVGHNVFRVWRWRALLEPVRPGVPFRPMFAAVILGYMTSWVVPGRIGEVVRPLALCGKEPDVPLGPCIGTVVADRLLDAISVLVLFALGVWLVPLSGEALEYAALIRTGAVALSLGMLAFVGLMLMLSAHSHTLDRWLAGRGGVVRWLGRTLLAVAEGLRALRSPRLLLRVALQSALAWGTIAVATWVGIRSAGAEVPFAAVLFIMPLLVVGVAIPTPGGAGSYHGLMKVGLLLFGVSEVAAVSAGLMVHASITIPIILLGMVLLWTEGFSWRHLVAGARQIRTLGDGAAPAPANPMMEGVS